MNGFRKTGAISDSGIALAFAPERDGVVPGEGAALWMLESEESALAAGRVPWLEICGFGCAHDARSIAGFDLRGCGAVQAMQQSLADAGIGPEGVACIVASASGSRAGDEMEARALETVFADRLPQTPACAPKAAFGEAMGASGALCAVVAGMALQRQLAPPTANFAVQGARVPLSSGPVPISGEFALVNAFSCDGNNASLVIRLWKN
jgi:3-oxoacyl-(acyl-carrier-protein) synthase